MLVATLKSQLYCNNISTDLTHYSIHQLLNAPIEVIYDIKQPVWKAVILFEIFTCSLNLSRMGRLQVFKIFRHVNIFKSNFFMSLKSRMEFFIWNWTFELLPKWVTNPLTKFIFFVKCKNNGQELPLSLQLLMMVSCDKYSKIVWEFSFPVQFSTCCLVHEDSR